MEKVHKAIGYRAAAAAALVTPAGALVAATIALGSLARRWQGAEAMNREVVMVPATAIGLLLAVCALLLVRPQRSAAAKSIGCLVAAVTMVLGLVIVGQYAADWKAVPGTLVAGGGWWMQRPSPTTGLGFIFIGASLLALGAERLRRWAGLGAAATLVVALTALIGHAYGVSVLYGLNAWGGTAVSTAVALGALGLGAIFADPSHGIAAVFLSDSAGGYLLRRLMPVALLAPPLLGWFALSGQKVGLVDAEFGTALLDVSLVVLLIGLVVRQAKVLHDFDAERERLLAQEREAREEVAKSESNFRTLGNSIHQLAWMADSAGWIFWYNERWYGYTGTTLEEMQGWGWQKVHHPEHVDQVVKRIRHAFESGEPWEDTFPLRSKTGEYRWFLSRALPIKDADGNVLRWFGTNTDVTEQREAAARERAAREQVTNILESITDAFFAVDREWRFTYVNREAERLLQRPRDELLGRNLWTEFPEAVGATFQREYQRAITEQETVHFEEHYAPLGIWVDVHAYPSADGLSVYFRDVTARKLAEQRLRESEERYRLLADMIPQNIWTTDAAGHHTYFSRRWYDYSGATPEESRGEGWLEYIHPDDKERTIARWGHSLRTGEPYSIEYRFRGVDGKYRWWLGKATPLRNEAGEIVEWFGTTTDISERKQFEEERERLLREEQEARAEAERRQAELERVTESRARLMRGFSHDVRNPLGIAEGHAWLLGNDKTFGGLSEKQRDSLQRIQRSIRTSISLIDDLLDLARAEAGEIELKRVETDVGQLTREIAEDFRAQAMAVGLTLDIRAPDKLRAETDQVRTRQILGNLLSNAVKYAPHGKVTVDAAIGRAGAPGPGAWIAVSVTDTGPGIPAGERERIFDEFTRLDPKAQQGAGVGLAISRHIARLMGGDISVQSEVGRGSTFTLWLPSVTPISSTRKADERTTVTKVN